MRVVIDTNIIMDIFLKREPFFQKSYEVFDLIVFDIVEGGVTANSITDIYYLLNRQFKDSEKSKSIILQINELLAIYDTTAIDISQALISEMTDFEDAVVASTAKREKADYIITRNIKDFERSAVKAVTPDEFIAMQK